MPDQENRRYIDGKLHYVRECPECDGWGEIERAVSIGDDEYENVKEDCETCEGEGYIKK